jgi:hypothetical protein
VRASLDRHKPSPDADQSVEVEVLTPESAPSRLTGIQCCDWSVDVFGNKAWAFKADAKALAQQVHIPEWLRRNSFVTA